MTSVTDTLLVLGAVFIVFGVVCLISDMLTLRARRRRIARRQRVQRILAYTIHDGRQPFNPVALPTNVIQLDPWSRKVDAA